MVCAGWTAGAGALIARVLALFRVLQAPLEAFDLASGIDEALLTGEEWMALLSRRRRAGFPSSNASATSCRNHT